MTGPRSKEQWERLDRENFLALESTLRLFRATRPTDRSPVSRIYAVTITLLEQAVGHFKYMMEETDAKDVGDS